MCIHVGSEYVLADFVPERRWSAIFRWIVPFNMQMIYLWTAVTVMERDKYFLVYSALPESWKTSRILVIVTFGEFLYTVSFCNTMYLLFYVTYTYLASSKFWLNHIWYVASYFYV